MASSHRIHFFHVIWSTKLRQDRILPKMQNPLYAYIAGIIRNHGGNAMQIGGTANHVHVLMEVSNLDKFSGVMRNVKACSTSWLKQEYSECSEFGWQDGFGSFSVSFSQIERIVEYIRNQEEHHRHQTFEEEYRVLLHRHEDERYLFG